jgi:hypothetical protein
MEIVNYGDEDYATAFGTADAPQNTAVVSIK